MKKKILVGVVLVFVLAAVAAAQYAKPENAIKYRKAQMVLIVHHFGSMGEVIKGQVTHDAAGFATHAAAVQMIAGLGWDAFITAGSDQGDTRLKAAALKEPARFMAAADAFEAATAGLVKAADDGELSKIKPEFGAVAQSCGDCHKSFRK